jgi:hypothetical protein
MTHKEERWMSFNICWYIFQQAGMIKEQLYILSWYEWSGFYIGSYSTSEKVKASFVHFPIMTDKKGCWIYFNICDYM